MPDSHHQRAYLTAFGRAVRQMRDERGMSAEELGDATGTTREGIEALETGRLDPSFDLMLSLADALGTRPGALLVLAEQLKDAS